MPIKHQRITAVALSVGFLLFFLSSCGSLDEERTAGNGSGTGVIAAFGSVTVNGIRYASVGSPVIRFGTDAPGAANHPETDLRIGMIVRVNGTFDRIGRTGSYDNIVFFSEVSGPIDNASVDPTTNRFRVLEKIVVVDASTVFDNNTGLRGTSPLASGDPVQVSGMFTNGGMGTIRATRVARIASTTQVEIKGVAANVVAGSSFLIGGITVSTSAGTRLPDGFPVAGDNVYVVGAATGTTIAATLVEKLSAAGNVRAGGKIAVDGVALGPPAASVFTLFGPNGPLAVRIDGTTLFTGGTSGNIASGIRLEAEGTLDASRTVLQAASITFIRDTNNAILEGTVTGKTASTLTILGKTVTFTMFTRFLDRTGTGRPFNFASVIVGNRVRAGGFFDNTAQALESLLLERTSPDTTSVLQGIVTGSNPILRTLDIMGISVQTAPGVTTYRLINGTIAANDAEFFAVVFPGSTSVRATGIFQAPSTLNPTNEAEIVP